MLAGKQAMRPEREVSCHSMRLELQILSRTLFSKYVIIFQMQNISNFFDVQSKYVLHFYFYVS